MRATHLLALELFREGRVSLGRAAELAGTSIEEFMDFSAQRQVSLHYSDTDLDENQRHSRSIETVIVVSNSSPLITLARIGRLELMRQLFGRIHIAAEVHEEVVIRGAGRPASEAVGRAGWIETHPPAGAGELAALRARHPLGSGELATVLLAQTIRADLAILDERAARRLGQVPGCGGHGLCGPSGAGPSTPIRDGFAPGL